MKHQPPPSSSSSSQSLAPPQAESVDIPLHTIGFVFEVFSPQKVSGRLLVTEKCCQPFKVLHGGVSALIAESLASLGAYLACGGKRVAGIHVSINHIKHADLGDVIFAEATPLNVGRTIQVWEVRMWKTDHSNSKAKCLVSSSRVSLVSNMSAPEQTNNALETLAKYAKL
ncbi:hypothetical protein Nepgr_030469 [Nepenthes gracilis]|uniref:Thioesterase domain-containing protein n=1 Tax=Nepenthes gracilis TaxID=150966 RepID=A0AAD3TGR9_NEPGR|nr:hypothetical protein Nepgr_030469 [Nepenthes gracilis]